MANAPGLPLDFAAFQSPNFDHISWINKLLSQSQDDSHAGGMQSASTAVKALTRPEPIGAREEAQALTAHMRLQLYGQDLCHHLEETVNSAVLRVPRVLSEVDRLQQEGKALRTGLTDLLGTISSRSARNGGASEEGDQEKPSCLSIDSLRSLHVKKTALESCASVFRQIRSLEERLEALNGVFARGDAEAISAHISDMTDALASLAPYPERHEKYAKKLGAAKDRLAKMVDRSARDRLRAGDLAAGRDLAVLARVGRAQTIMRDFMRSVVEPLRKPWEEACRPSGSPVDYAAAFERYVEDLKTLIGTQRQYLSIVLGRETEAAGGAGDHHAAVILIASAGIMSLSPSLSTVLTAAPRNQRLLIYTAANSLRSSLHDDLALPVASTAAAGFEQALFGPFGSLKNSFVSEEQTQVLAVASEALGAPLTLQATSSSLEALDVRPPKISAAANALFSAIKASSSAVVTLFAADDKLYQAALEWLMAMDLVLDKLCLLITASATGMQRSLSVASPVSGPAAPGGRSQSLARPDTPSAAAAATEALAFDEVNLCAAQSGGVSGFPKVCIPAVKGGLFLLNTLASCDVSIQSLQISVQSTFTAAVSTSSGAACTFPPAAELFPHASAVFSVAPKAAKKTVVDALSCPIIATLRGITASLYANTTASDSMAPDASDPVRAVGDYVMQLPVSMEALGTEDVGSWLDAIGQVMCDEFLTQLAGVLRGTSNVSLLQVEADAGYLLHVADVVADDTTVALNAVVTVCTIDAADHAAVSEALENCPDEARASVLMPIIRRRGIVL